jgi:hypothetical protein
MIKLLNLFFYLFILLFNSQAKADNLLSEGIALFDGKLLIASKHSFGSNNKINFSDQFKLTQKKNNFFEYKLENQKYKIIRHITYQNSKINITDKYVNKLDQTIGIISDYKFSTINESQFSVSGKSLDKNNVKQDLIGENSQLIFKSKNISFGFYFNDLFSKINSNVIKINNKELIVKNTNLIIGPNQTYIKNFDIYFFNKELEYFEYINFLRNKLDVNSTIDGNFFFIDVYANQEILKNTEKLKSFFKNYKVKYILVSPWLDYSSFNFYNNKSYTRSEVKEHFIKIKKVIKSIDPDIKLLVSLQSNVIDLNYEVQSIIKGKNQIIENFNFYNIDYNELINKSNLNLKKNELIFAKDNKILFETYYHDWKYGRKKILEIALPLKGYDNGYLLKRLKNQIDFVIDEIKYDGIYIDQLNQYFIDSKQRFSYGGGASLNNNVGVIDINTGNIVKEYEDISLNTLEFEKKLIQYATSKTKYLFANTHHLHDQLRKEKIIRFSEGFWYFWSEKMWKKKSKDLFIGETFLRSHLSTPVSLSLGTIQKGDWKKKPHNALVKNLRFCLYNANLMYFLEQDISKLNIDDKKINIFQKLYPIKIKEIYQGKIIGEEKIITINDIKISKSDYKKYNFFYFDEEGYIIENSINKITYVNDEVLFSVQKDEILVLEKNKNQ